MLSLQTVLPNTLELMRTLMFQPELEQTRLVGGTALALQYGHRQSVDLDFFGHVTEDTDELTLSLSETFSNITKRNCTKHIKGYMLNGIKVDIVNYDYPWIDAPVVEEGLRLASPKDIAAMKVNAVIGRGTKKDFIDVYFLLRHYSFEELISFYMKKYAEASEYRALLSMTYFEDAESDPMPYMYEDVSWDSMKNRIRQEVENYMRRHSK